MKSIRRILVPIDFSAGSWEALEYAILLSQRLGASIDVLHAWEPPYHAAGLDDHPLVRFARTERGRRMGIVLTTLEDRGLSVRGRIEPGPAAQAIVSAARDVYDLIVMGTHGHTGLYHVLRGSVAESIMRHAPCPVLMVRPDDRMAARPDEPSLKADAEAMA